MLQISCECPLNFHKLPTVTKGWLSKCRTYFRKSMIWYQNSNLFLKGNITLYKTSDCTTMSRAVPHFYDFVFMFTWRSHPRLCRWLCVLTGGDMQVQAIISFMKLYNKGFVNLLYSCWFTISLYLLSPLFSFSLLPLFIFSYPPLPPPLPPSSSSPLLPSSLSLFSPPPSQVSMYVWEWREQQ